MQPKVFIAYSSEDKKYAFRLINDLSRFQIKCWFDEFEVLVGHDICDAVFEGLRKSDFIAVILTENAVNSRWVHEELNFAKQKSISEGGKRIILPLLFENCKIPVSVRHEVVYVTVEQRVL